MVSESQRAPGYRFQYQVPPTPLPLEDVHGTPARNRCTMYMPAKPAPITTASSGPASLMPHTLRANSRAAEYENPLLISGPLDKDIGHRALRPSGSP